MKPINNNKNKINSEIIFNLHLYSNFKRRHGHFHFHCKTIIIYIYFFYVGCEDSELVYPLHTIRSIQVQPQVSAKRSRNQKDTVYDIYSVELLFGRTLRQIVLLTACFLHLFLGHTRKCYNYSSYWIRRKVYDNCSRYCSLEYNHSMHGINLGSINHSNRKRNAFNNLNRKKKCFNLSPHSPFTANQLVTPFWVHIRLES